MVAHLPPYFPLSPVEMVTFYRHLAERIDGPLFIYNMPPTTHMSIPIECLEELSDDPRIVGLKDSEKDLDRLKTVLDTFRAFRMPFLLLLLILLGSLYLGLSKRFTFINAATSLPMGSRRRVDIVMAPSSAGVPARREPGVHEAVVHRFAADETGVVATGARAVLRSEIWVEVETPEGDGWINA